MLVSSSLYRLCYSDGENGVRIIEIVTEIILRFCTVLGRYTRLILFIVRKCENDRTIKTLSRSKVDSCRYKSTRSDTQRIENIVLYNLSYCTELVGCS